MKLFLDISSQISSMVTQKGGAIEINSMFMDPVNRVLWRVVTGKPIEEETAAILTDAIRESFRISERAGFTDLLQERKYTVSNLLLLVISGNF